MNCNMKGKTLVISGGTKGIGKECVYKFASNGINVAFTYNSNGEIAEEICKDVETKFEVTDIIPFAPLANIAKSTLSSPEKTKKFSLCEIIAVARSSEPVASFIP